MQQKFLNARKSFKADSCVELNPAKAIICSVPQD